MHKNKNMNNDRSLFDRLDSLEEQNARIIALLSRQQTQGTPVVGQAQPTKLELLQQFVKKSKKSWMWFGNKKEFARAKTLAIISLVLLLNIGIISAILTGLSFGMFSTFSLFENVWMVFAIVMIAYAAKAKRVYEVKALAASSPRRYIEDKYGMMFDKKEKFAFKLFRWLAILAVIGNIVIIWTKTSSLNIVATVFEVLFLASIIFAFFANLHLYAQYSIIHVEGANEATKQKVALVLPPGEKYLMPEEDFKKKVPYLYM